MPHSEITNLTPETSQVTLEPNNGYYSEKEAPPPQATPPETVTVVNNDIPMDVAVASGIQVDFTADDTG